MMTMTVSRSICIEEVHEEVQELRHQVSVMAADVRRLARRVDAMYRQTSIERDHPDGYDMFDSAHVRRFGVGK